MLDFTALAQSCPGAIAVKCCYFGRLECIWPFAGMIVATLGTILPLMIILSVVSFSTLFFSTNVWVAVVLKRNAGRSCSCHFRCWVTLEKVY